MRESLTHSDDPCGFQGEWMFGRKKINESNEQTMLVEAVFHYGLGMV